MINKHGFGKEYIKKNNEFYQGEFDGGYRNGNGRLITNELEVYDALFSRGDVVLPLKTNKHIMRSKYTNMIQNFVQDKNKQKPHLIILS